MTDKTQHCPGCEQSAREIERLRDRIERQRGALKTASGWVRDWTTLSEANERADKLLEWAGDMEPSIEQVKTRHCRDCETAAKEKQ